MPKGFSRTRFLATWVWIMPLNFLSLRHFRNHGDSQLHGLARFNVLTGDNGAGKTNILEAISLLAPGRGMRRAPLSQMAAMSGPGGFAVSADLGDVKIGTGVTADMPERRKVRVNGAAASANSLAEWLSIIWLTPAMDRLFMESAGGRRQFLDRLVLAIDPLHARHSSRYELAVRERNRLLADDVMPDSAWLDAVETRMAEHGACVAASRAALVAQLNSVLDSEADEVFARPVLALASCEPGSAETLLETWRGARQRDRQAKRTLDGPHRDDLIVTMRQKGQAAALCSTGEQKAMLIAIILAHSDLVASLKGNAPVLLLDEIAAHLDPLRRGVLYDRLSERTGQVWMTGTDRALFSGITSPRHFTVSGGAVHSDN